MTSHDEIDQFAIKVERTIAETESFINGLPDFAPRSERSQKMQRAVSKPQKNGR